MGEQMTLKQVLEATIEVLMGIQIPVSMAEQIGKPILGCTGNLRECIKAIEAGERAETKPEEEPEIQVTEDPISE